MFQRMLHMKHMLKLSGVYIMAKGSSGRIVLEIDSNLKRKLYSVIALENKTLKDWFIECANDYVKKHSNSKSSFKAKNEI